jgi:hypothetical protein
VFRRESSRFVRPRFCERFRIITFSFCCSSSFGLHIQEIESNESNREGTVPSRYVQRRKKDAVTVTVSLALPHSILPFFSAIVECKWRRRPPRGASNRLLRCNCGTHHKGGLARQSRNNRAVAYHKIRRQDDDGKLPGHDRKDDRSWTPGVCFTRLFATNTIDYQSTRN